MAVADHALAGAAWRQLLEVEVLQSLREPGDRPLPEIAPHHASGEEHPPEPPLPALPQRLGAEIVPLL